MVLPAAPKAPPASPPANNDSQSFSPHLDKAMADRKDTPASRENIAKPSQQKTNEAEHRPETADAKETLKTSSDNTLTEEHAATHLIKTMYAASEAQTDNPAVPLLGQPLDDTSAVFQFLTNIFTTKIEDTGGQQMAATQQALPNLQAAAEAVLTLPLEDTGGQQMAATQQALPNLQAAAEAVLTLPLAGTMNLAIAKSDTSALSIPSQGGNTENNAFLLELQKIIENSNESGTVAITVSDKTGKNQSGISNLKTTMATAESEPLPIVITSTERTGSQADEHMIVLPAGAEIPVDKANQSLSSTRHSIRQQYYEGQISPENKQESQTPSEERPQDNTFSSKTAQTTKENTTSALNPNQTSTFAQPLAFVQEAQKPTTVEGLSPVTLPSGIVVQQEDVIRQIMERFQISRRDNDTKVNIKLHPAELGELKISLSVKEGSVRANVVASSQYAQEIIEKNMTKLRAVLENQGFTIGEISVTSKSDTTGDFNLFERQLFSQNNYTPPSAKNTRSSGALFIMEDPGTREQTAATGVNVTI